MDRNLQFYDACIIENYMYFSVLEFNGLFRLKIGENNAEFLGAFPCNSVMHKIQHRKMIYVDKKLIFFPFTGNDISVYSIRESRFSSLQTEDAEGVNCTNIIRLGESWLTIPCDLNKDFYMISESSLTVKKIKKLGENIKKIQKDDNDFVCDIFGSCVDEQKFLYIAIQKSNRYLKVNLKNFEIEEIKVGLEKLDNIFVYQGQLWATSFGYNKVLCRDLITGIEKIYSIDESVERSCYTIFACNNNLYILPCFGEKIWKYNKNKDEWEEFINVFANKDFERVHNYTLFVGWHIEGNILELYPRSGNGILKINLETRETEVIPVLMDDIAFQQVTIEFEKEARTIISKTYEKESCIGEHKDVYTLTNYLSYIQSK